MYTLYSRPGSGGFVVEAALRLAQQPFTLINVAKGAEGEDFRKISPLAQVPALVMQDGRAVTESGAISVLIAERHAQAELAPQPGSPHRAEFLRWMFFLSSALYPALLRCFYSDRYTSDAAGTKAVQDAAIDESDRGFAIVEKALDGKDWLAGERCSIADVYLLMLAHWHPVGDRPRPEWTNIVRLCAALKQQPTIAELNHSHKLW